MGGSPSASTTALCRIVWKTGSMFPTPHSPIRSPSAHRRGSAFAEDRTIADLPYRRRPKKESCTTPSELSAIRKVSRNGLRGDHIASPVRMDHTSHKPTSGPQAVRGSISESLVIRSESHLGSVAMHSRRLTRLFVVSWEFIRTNLQASVRAGAVIR